MWMTSVDQDDKVIVVAKENELLTVGVVGEGILYVKEPCEAFVNDEWSEETALSFAHGSSAFISLPSANVDYDNLSFCFQRNGQLVDVFLRDEIERPDNPLFLIARVYDSKLSALDASGEKEGEHLYNGERLPFVPIDSNATLGCSFGWQRENLTYWIEYLLARNVVTT